MGIDKDKRLSTDATKLRRKAEERLCAKPEELHPLRTEEEPQRLLHELQVHQIELEMQNAELRQARDDVEKILKLYTDLYDFAPVGYFTLDRNGDIRAANLIGASLLGVERTRLIGRRFGLFVADQDRPLLADFFEELFADQDKHSCEVALTIEENSPLYVQIDAVACDSGQECNVAVNNITKRRRAKDELFEKRKQLEELNRTLEVRITRAVDDLRHKDQMLILQDRRAVMGEMINNIAHQWRQPLNTLALHIQELPLVYNTGEFSREFLEEHTGKCMRVIQHMSLTIDDFRNFFRSDKEMISFSISKVIARTLFLIEKSFKAQQIGIVLQTDGDPTANGYPNEYSQVLLNILINARDSLVGNNVEDARISLHAFMEGSTSVVTISDNAGGVSEKIIDRLFNPYFTTKGPDKGTGIGLFMSRTIIEKNMGGRLTVRNTGSGAEFRIEV